jgi:hypothetical protein
MSGAEAPHAPIQACGSDQSVRPAAAKDQPAPGAASTVHGTQQASRAAAKPHAPIPTASGLTSGARPAQASVQTKTVVQPHAPIRSASKATGGAHPASVQTETVVQPHTPISKGLSPALPPHRPTSARQDLLGGSNHGTIATILDCVGGFLPFGAYLDKLVSDHPHDPLLAKLRR